MHNTTTEQRTDGSIDLVNAELLSILDEVVELRDRVMQDSEQRSKDFSSYFESNFPNNSAQNLAHYLSLRQHDLRPLQLRLSHSGLSSLGRSESNVIGSLNQLIDLLTRATDKTYALEEDNCLKHRNIDAAKYLKIRSRSIFGSPPARRHTYIMVTLPIDASWDYSLIEGLLVKGMDCARINCARGHASDWKAIVKNVRNASDKLNKPCKILMDLAGQKIRTGKIRTGPAIKHIKVKRNVYGRLVEPTNIILDDENNDYMLGSTSEFKYQLSLPRTLHTQLAIGDRLRLADLRGKKEKLTSSANAR